MAKKEEKAVKNKNKENKVKKHFFKDFNAELKKVIWPTPKQLINNTIAVIVIVVITGAIVFVLDTIFKAINEQGITKLQSYVVEEFGEKNENQEEEEHNHDHEHNDEENVTSEESTTSEDSTDSNQ